jgi:hypothetical protein
MITSALVAAINRFIEGAAPSTSTQKDALDEVLKFRARTTTSPWKIDRARVSFRLEELVKDPSSVQQGACGTCGPAAFLRCWIPEDPLGFVKFAGELYDTGKAKLGTMEIEPDSDLVEQDYDKNVDGAIKAKYPGNMHMLCPRAEWMVMCSLIDDANHGLDYQGTPDEDWSHGSMPSQMNTWFEAVGHTVDSLSSWDMDEMAQALSPVPLKRHIILVVHTVMLSHRIDTVRSALQWALGFPNHFIVLDSPISKTIGDSDFQLAAWTWGETTTYKVTEDELADYVDEAIRAQH